VTGHAIGGLAMLAGLSSQSRLPSGASEVMRRHVFADTQLIHSALIRAAVDLLGADNVMAGSDWPIVDDGPIAGVLATAMHDAGLSADEQEAIAGGNCRRLLGLG
jgi:aminocarboxymuconate-semialdehyde decarboxylase